MKIELFDLIDNNETLANGLFTLAELIEFVEQHGTSDDLYGLAELIKLIAFAGKHQTNRMQFVFSRLNQQP